MFEEIIILLGRSCVLMMLVATLFFSASRNKGATNIPLFCGYGLFFLYSCYIFSGISFGNGTSLGAEFLFALLFSMLTIGFTIGNTLSKNKLIYINRANIRQKAKLNKIPVSNGYIFATCIIFFIYINILTNWSPLLLISQATELKHYRLNLIFVQKDFFLFFLESIVISMLIIGLIWSIVSHRDIKSSDFALSAFLILIALQVISTGARSPLIGFFLLFVVTLHEGQKSSFRAKILLHLIKRYIPLILISGIIYMGWTTSSRIEFEGLAISVFKSYFDIVDFGRSTAFFQSDSGISFLFGTIVVYAADTFNNFVLRFQLSSTINHSFGYQLLFPYASFLEPLTRNYTNAISTWREISSQNNEILINVADAATQWSTVFGDFVWDFGVIGSVGIIFLFSTVLGYLIGSANHRPSTANTILKLYLVGSLIMPLVSPFSSLQFHIVCIFLLGFNFVFKKRFAHILQRKI